MKKKLQAFLIFLLTTLFSVSQNGPAGVGTNSTSTVQNRIWYKSDVGVYTNAGTILAISGNSVQQWNDQSGVANNGVQGNAIYRPVYLNNVANGFPALRFNGSSWITASVFPGIANNVGYTYLIVVRDTAFTPGTVTDGSGDYIIDRGPPGAEASELAGLKVANTNKFGFQKRDVGGGGLGGPVSLTPVSTASFQVVAYRQTPGATKVYDIFVDGTLETTLSSADANYVPPVPQIGHHYQPANSGMKGYVTEFILYNANLNNAQINILNSYLSAKYGLTMASNDKYVGDTPVNGNYDFDVVGVGTDLTGANLSAASAISGGLEATQSVLFDNDEYLLYGHQTGGNFINSTDIGGMSVGPSVCRWNRNWYFDWRHVGGANETVDLVFDLSDGGIPAVPLSPLTNYKLLYRTGLSGNWTELADASSISGDRISFNGIVYSTGSGYYTIGTLDNVNSPLPIGLIDFNAAACDGNICLNWTTATEKNNDHFTIERSTDGINFINVGQVKGAGNSQQNLSYSFIDRLALQGQAYYHLKQTDYNGAYSYSSIKTVNLDDNKGVFFNLYPSPNQGLFTISMQVDAEVLVSDATGQEIFKAIIKKGETKMNFQYLLKGIYFVKVNYEGRQQSVKFVKE